MAKKSLVGLDIGHRNVRAVYIQSQRDEVQIAASGCADLLGEGDGEEEHGQTPVPEHLQQVLRELWKSASMRNRQVAVGTNQVRTVTRLVTFPHMPYDDLSQVIEMEASRHLPIDADNLLVDFCLTDVDEEDSSVQVVLAGTSRQGIEQLIEPLDGAGLRPVAFDVSSVAAHRALIHPAFNIEGMGEDEPVKDPEMDAASVLVDLGYTESRICIFRGPVPVLNRSIPVGGRDMTIALSDARDLEPEAAEQLKKELGLVKKESWRSPLFDDLRVPLQQLSRQILQSLQFFTGDFRDTEIACMYLYGATAAMPGLAQHISEFLADQGADSLLWKEGEPVVKCVGDIRTEEKSISGVDYLTAAGLALWGVVQ